MTTHGRYTIVRKLAQGGMAEIFLATQRGAEDFERPVVLKRILPELSADAHFCNNLIDEAHIAMGLTHSNIVQVLDLGKSHKRTFLVMEFIDGWDVHELLRRARKASFELPVPLGLFIIAETCRALAYAHAKKHKGKPLSIVHRDVSPHNILVSDQGEVKLTDFGIAKALNKRDKTASGVIKGKFAFMSPEQATGGKLDARSDIFSLGSTLYLIVTGKRPFEGAPELDLLLKVRDARFEPPEKVRPGLDAGLCRIIKKSMQRLPKERYQSADEMLVDCEKVLRTSMGSAGQTELKEWLGALTVKDGQLSAGKTAPPKPPPLPTLAPPAAEEDDGILIELEDADFDLVSSKSGGKDADPALPPTVQSRSSAEPAEPRRSSWGRRIFALFALAAAGVAGYVFLGPSLEFGALKLDTPHPSTPAVAAGRDAAAAPVRPIVVGLNAPGAPDASLIEEPPDAQLAVAEAPDAAAPGHDASVAVAPVFQRPVSSPNKAPPSEDGMVSVRIVTDPPGATVRIDKKTYSPTPFPLRFRPGVTYELNLSKDGYLPVKRLVPVLDRADQVVAVRLAKDPAAKKSPPPPPPPSPPKTDPRHKPKP